MGAGSGPAALQLAARIQDAKARAEKEQHDRDREEVRDEQIKDDARRADQRILQKHIDQQTENQRLLIAETEARTKRDKAFAQDREEPAYRIAIHGLNVFDPDFPSHLLAVNARYPNISVTDKGRGIAALKMADAGMKFTAQGIEYIPGRIQDTYRKAEETLGFEELRDMASYDRRTGRFVQIDSFAVEQAVRKKRIDEARNLAALPGESVSLGKDGEVQYRKSVPAIPPYNREKAEAAAAAAKKKADAAARVVVVKERLKGINIYLDDLADKTKTKGWPKEKIAEEKQRHLAERDRLLDTIYDETPDQPAPDKSPAPPVPKEVPKKTPEQPAPSATGAAPITPESIWGAPQWVPESLGAPPAPTAPTAPTTPPAPTKRIPFKDRLKEPASQPQASAAPDMDTLTASASDFSRFSGRREEIDSDPALSAEFNAASESMSQTLQSLGYDKDAAAASGGYVADGSTIEFDQDEDGEPVAVTVDPYGARTPLKKAASEAVVSIDSSSTAA
jgi:hypothetical protein